MSAFQIPKCDHIYCNEIVHIQPLGCPSEHRVHQKNRRVFFAAQLHRTYHYFHKPGIFQQIFVGVIASSQTEGNCNKYMS
jgi:hypothetical protein